MATYTRVPCPTCGSTRCRPDRLGITESGPDGNFHGHYLGRYIYEIGGRGQLRVERAPLTHAEAKALEKNLADTLERLRAEIKAAEE